LFLRLPRSCFITTKGAKDTKKFKSGTFLGILFVLACFFVSLVIFVVQSFALPGAARAGLQVFEIVLF
jgi:hypothetical protein